MSSTRVPVSVLVTTRNEEANLASTLAALDGWAGEVHVLDSESGDRTLEIAREHGCVVTSLPYEHGRIIPWIFQWGLDHLTLGHEWILLLEADQRLLTLYADPDALYRRVVLNIAASGRFSSDRTISEDAREIWGATPCAVK